jgi:hypothetical protein
MRDPVAIASPAKAMPGATWPDTSPVNQRLRCPLAPNSVTADDAAVVGRKGMVSGLQNSWQHLTDVAGLGLGGE